MKAETYLALEGELNIYRAAEVKSALLAAIGKISDELEIDLSEVTEIDSAGLQLLLATNRTGQEYGFSVRISRPSEPVLELLRLFGASTLLGAEAATFTSVQAEGERNESR